MTNSITQLTISLLPPEKLGEFCMKLEDVLATTTMILLGAESVRPEAGGKKMPGC